MGNQMGDQLGLNSNLMEQDNPIKIFTERFPKDYLDNIAVIRTQVMLEVLQ
jgi:hypothetical protein